MSSADAFSAGQQARPVFLTDEHLEYLDDLRKSGVTNMFGATSYLMEDFGNLTKNEAAAILGYWMKSFGKPDR